MVDSIKSTIMTRDGLNTYEADDLIEEALEELRDVLAQGGSLEDAEQVVHDNFGLEPDYLEELLYKV